MTPPLQRDRLDRRSCCVVVAIGFAVAYLRYGTPRAQRDAVERLRTETIRMPRVLVNAYYFDAAYDMLLVRPARAIGAWFVRVFDPHVIDAAVREAAISAQWLGHLFRSFQTGLVRAYALSIAFGVVCFVAYYALAFGAAPMIVTALVLAPILIGLALYAVPRERHRAGADRRGRRRRAGVRAGGRRSARARRVGALALAPVRRVVPPRLRADLVLDRAAAGAGDVRRCAGAQRLRARATFAAQLLVLQGAMNGLFLAKDLLLFALFWDLCCCRSSWCCSTRGRTRAPAWKYLIYNLAGGLALLLATAAFGMVSGTTDVIGLPSRAGRDRHGLGRRGSSPASRSRS